MAVLSEFEALALHDEPAPCNDAKLDDASSRDEASHPTTPLARFPTDLSAFSFGSKLGAGATATVFEATVRHSGEAVALKLVGRPDRAVARRPVSNVQRHFASEMDALIRVRHPNVMRLYATNDAAVHEGHPTRLLVLEHCPHGELFSVMDKLKALPSAVARTLALQLWGALAACHQEGIAHRDIKPENILLASDWSLRLADFGFATAGDAATSTSVGTPGYMAPEVLAGGRMYQPMRADVWSAGVVTFILLMGNPPVSSAAASCWFYRRLKNREYREFWAAHEKYGPNLDEAAKDMLQRMLDPCLRARPTAQQVLQDEGWLMHGPKLSATELETFLETNMH